MSSLNNSIAEYKRQLEKGDIKKAYVGLMEYLLNLKIHLKNKYPDYHVSGNLYYGYMEMSYFSFVPQSLKRRKLKVAIVLIHETCSFEIWLAGYNKNIQKEFWILISESSWNKYYIPYEIEGIDYIMNHVLDDNPDFDKPDVLTRQLEKGIMQFIKDVEDFLAKH